LESFEKWTAEEKPGLNHATARLNGYVLEGGGEILVWNASDFENFMEPRREWNEQVQEELAAVTRVITSQQWPIRIHATYDETISRILDVFEPVFKEMGYKSRWAIDHAETITPRNIARIKAMGGGITVQNRLSFAGEFFAQRYGDEAAASAQPLRAIVDAGIPVGAGTDATRVSTYNPWLSLYWMVTGKTVGGTARRSPNICSQVPSP
jgi:predicted amidohydrolase YtcJ